MSVRRIVCAPCICDRYLQAAVVLLCTRMNWYWIWQTKHVSHRYYDSSGSFRDHASAVALRISPHGSYRDKEVTAYIGEGGTRHTPPVL